MRHGTTGKAQSLAASGKLPRRRKVVIAGAASPKPRKKSRLWIKDRIGGESYLIDTGAEISLEAASDYDRRHAPRGTPLQAANGSDIATFGVRTKTVRIGTKTLIWRFVVADVSSNIIGADFLAHHNLLVDMRRKRLLDATTFEVIRVDSAPADVDATDGVRRPSIADVSHRFKSVVGEFPSTTNPETLSFSPKHDVTHFIETTGPPVRSHARPLSSRSFGSSQKGVRGFGDYGHSPPIQQSMGIATTSRRKARRYLATDWRLSQAQWGDH